MKMNTLEKLQAHLAAPAITILTVGYDMKDVAPHLVCADGTTMSVQASRNHYCEPRDNSGPYSHVEVLCCGVVPTWSEYGDGEDLYGYIPIELVVEEIDRRGGIKEE
jgi:hypothetical protein